MKSKSQDDRVICATDQSFLSSRVSCNQHGSQIVALPENKRLWAQLKIFFETATLLQ